MTLLRPRPTFAAAVCATLVVVGAATPAAAAQPRGYLDSAGCETIVGWAQDPDVADTAIPVHIYLGGPAGSGASAIVVAADVHRDDLCTAIGSCAHGYAARSPLSLHDGLPHDVFAYGIDQQAEGNPALGNSPRVLQCDPSTIIGVKRKITSPATLDAWAFDAFMDQLPLPKAVADAMADGQAMPDVPELWTHEGAYWLVDRGSLRPVSPAAMIAWRFDATAALEKTTAELAAVEEGPALRARPMTFVNDGVYVIDDETEIIADPTTSTSVTTVTAVASTGTTTGGGGGDGGGAGGTSDGGGCSITGPTMGGGSIPWLTFAGLAATVARVGRRRGKLQRRVG